MIADIINRLWREHDRFCQNYDQGSVLIRCNRHIERGEVVRFPWLNHERPDLVFVIHPETCEMVKKQMLEEMPKGTTHRFVFPRFDK